MKLMIVESPNKTKKIQSILGPDWKVVASVGHVRDLPQKSIGVSAPDFDPEYEATERGADVLKRIGIEMKKANEIYLATDPDREGEAISWHLKEALKIKSYKRVTFNEITKAGIESGLQSARQIDMDLVKAQEARRVLDRIVGYTVSPILCGIMNQKLSAGRVQSPALKILVVREREIRNFVSKKHFTVEALFPFKATWNFSNFLQDREEKVWTDRAFAERIAEKTEFFVNEFTESDKTVSPPAPFTTSTLQQAASASLNLGAKKCMDLAQELFAGGHITYHRTDSVNFSAEAINEIREYAKAQNLPLPGAPRKFKSKDSAQEAHEAIRPTHINDKAPLGLSDDAIKLYEMIWNRSVACQLADAVYKARKVILSAGVEDGKEVLFNATGSTLTFKGWKSLIDDAAENEDDADPEFSNPVPSLIKGIKIQPTSISIVDKNTSPPHRFTQAKLVKKLEDEGIGRPSTYAAIIEGLQNRGYAEEKKKQFLPTELGEKVFDLLDGKFSFMELPYTREMESQLDLISTSKIQYKEAVSKSHEVLMKEIPSLGNPSAPGTSYAINQDHKCPACETGFLQRKKGPSGFFWGCSEYKSGCKHSTQDENGKPATKTDLVKCPSCEAGQLRRIKGKNGFFWGCSEFKNGCKKSAQDKNGKPVLDA